MNPTLPGSPFLAYRDSVLHLEDVRLQDLAAQHGTPLFVYSKAAMLSALAAYQRGFQGRRAKVHYAMKANSSLAVLGSQVLQTHVFKVQDAVAVG